LVIARSLNDWAELGSVQGIGAAPTWLPILRSVSTSAARYQQLSSLTTKLAGKWWKAKVF